MSGSFFSFGSRSMISTTGRKIAFMTSLSFRLADKAPEVFVHARDVGVDPGEKPERAHALADIHVPAVDRRAADAPRRLEQLRLERNVDHFRHPQRGVQQRF